MVPEAIPDKLKAFYVVGGNPLVSMADSNAFREAFRRLDLLVVHDMFMTETAKEAHYVLPACSHLEKWGLAYTYNVCHCLPYLMLRKKCIEPIGESWSEWKVFTELAKRLGLGQLFPWESEEDLIRFELGPSGITFEQMLNDSPEGLYYGQKKYQSKEGMFATPTGTIEIYSSALAQVGANPLPVYIEPERSPRSSSREYLEKYPLILSTGHRNYYYVHSQFREVDELKAEAPHPLAEMGVATGKRFGLTHGDDIVVETNRGEARMKLALDERVAEGCIFVPHGWSGVANANLLTDTDCREKILGYPDVKSLMCSVRRAYATT
jgi:anaerobic selenocysteine-containing dehydrogenase